MDEVIESAVIKALKSMGYILDSLLEFQLNHTHPGLTEMASYFEEVLYERLDSRHEIIQLDLERSHLLVVHQLRKKHGIR